MKVRNVEQKDVETLAKQIVNVLAAPPYGEYWAPEVAGEYLSTLMSFDPGNCFCVEDDNGAVVGAIFFTARPYYLGKYAVVEEIFIAEKHRRKGYGKKLLEESLSRLKKKGINGITWKVNHKADSYPFSRKMGFTELPEWKYLIKILSRP
jgi:GNAT superfamily N-acetyltransferase